MNELVLVTDNEDYRIYKTKDGYKKEMKYKSFSSFKPEEMTKEKKVELFKVFNSDDFEKVIELKNSIGKDILVKNIIFKPYESFNETTGENETGVTSVICDDNDYYVTSSKTVYYNLINMIKAFGVPNENQNNIVVSVKGTKQTRGIQISLELKEVK